MAGKMLTFRKRKWSQTSSEPGLWKGKEAKKEERILQSPNNDNNLHDEEETRSKMSLNDVFMETNNKDLWLLDNQIQLSELPFYFDPHRMTKVYNGTFFEASSRLSESYSRRIVVKVQKLSPLATQEAQLMEAFQFSGFCPKLYGIFQHDDEIYVAMEKLTVDLFDLKFSQPINEDQQDQLMMEYEMTQSHYCDKLMSAASIFGMARQCCQALKEFHSIGYVHADIKPSNLMFTDVEKAANGDENALKLIDFGLSVRFRSDQGEILKPKKIGGLTGTPRYASLNVHCNLEPHRGDDFTSLYYTVHELICGELSWTKHEKAACDNKLRLKKIHSSKKFDHPIYEMVSSGPMKPYEAPMGRFVRYVENLAYDQKPDYTFLENCFREAQQIANEIENNFIEQSTPGSSWLMS